MACNSIVLTDSYIDSQIVFLNRNGFDCIFNSDNFDIMLEFIYSRYSSFSLFRDTLNEYLVDPVSEYCKLHLREFVLFVCKKYCSIDAICDFSEQRKSRSRLEAEICYLLESKDIRFLNQLKRLIANDDDLLEVLSDDDFSHRLKNFLMAKRFADK